MEFICLWGYSWIYPEFFSVRCQGYAPFLYSCLSANWYGGWMDSSDWKNTGFFHIIDLQICFPSCPASSFHWPIFLCTWEIPDRTVISIFPYFWVEFQSSYFLWNLFPNTWHLLGLPPYPTFAYICCFVFALHFWHNNECMQIFVNKTGLFWYCPHRSCFISWGWC